MYNNVTMGTTKRQKHEVQNHNLQMAWYVKKKKDINRIELIDIVVFKPNIRNVTKCFKINQKTYKITKTNKIAKAILK